VPRINADSVAEHVAQQEAAVLDAAVRLFVERGYRQVGLADIAAEVGQSPVYLTQAFQQVEGLPLYRYQMRLRLARALDLLGEYDDLTALGLDLGFSSHSHFTTAFRQAYGRSPSEFRQATRKA
jgi:AraC-like DNA-binding protein